MHSYIFFCYAMYTPNDKKRRPELGRRFSHYSKYFVQIIRLA